MKSRKKPKDSRKTKARRFIAAFFAMTILFQIVFPTAASALTSGASQPEVESFEPVGTSEMVDLFTGDFNYNIALLDVDGYPVNIAYHSGITMDQEASWVGLGWNINPGVINRGMRGIPDDFNGDNIEKELNMKPSKTYGVNTGAGIELFGTDKISGSLSYGIGVKYNNYSGASVNQSLKLSLSAGDQCKSPLSGSLGLNSSSEDGLSLQPSVSLSNKDKEEAKTENSMSLNVGLSVNSRAGLQYLTIGVSQTVQQEKGSKKKPVSGNLASSSFDFGMPTYTPYASLPMQNLSVTGSFKLGFEVYGLHPNFTIGGFYSAQKLLTNNISNPAYGYMNADEGTKYDNALMDFNREKDGSFTPSTPALPVTNFTYDIFSVSGQGVGGSYRAFRSDLGHVFDPRTYSTSDGYSVGVELGVANTFHVGADLTVNNVDGTSGRWENDNPAAARLTHRSSTGDALYEKYYFKEANEKSVDADPGFFDKAGKGNVKRVSLNQLSKFHTIADHYYAEGGNITSDNYRKIRDRRSQLFTLITKGELNDYGLEVKPGLYNNAPAHHIAEITTMRNDGARYVYGVAVYNKRQEETTFAVGDGIDNSGGRVANAATGLVTYLPGVDNSTGNKSGLDNYYSNTIMPAYAHSYLLTAVLSPDYIDSENNGNTTRGPSDGDFGTYTKFHYAKIENYNWRVPFGLNQAAFNEGLKSDRKDDKANYIYGEKELRYLDTIETKNYLAIFTLGDRKDGYGVANKDGGLATSNSMKRLDRISLYSKREYRMNPLTAVPIKVIHFEYDYSLCPGVPNNINGTGNDNGKLTLKRISFTYQSSNKGRLSPYVFEYKSFNPTYGGKQFDRWGNYKTLITDGLTADEYPYVEQDQASADQYSQAWSLTDIYLPSGGKIKVEYESDDYAYVQNKRAGQMFKVIGVEDEDNSSDFSASNASIPSFGTPLDLNKVTLTRKAGKRLIIKLQDKLTTNSDFQDRYLSNLDFIYFRFLMRIRGSKFEYVSSYLRREDIDIGKCKIDLSGEYGCIPIMNTQANDYTGPFICPITEAAIQFGRLNMPREVWSSVDESAMGGGFGKSLLVALINSDFTKNISDVIQGPNAALFDPLKYNVGHDAVMGKSWVRLNNPKYKKWGGGCRVKKISISDEWDGSGISENSTQAYSYGQEYNYTLEDGTSAGVASYEPQLGGDENPWKTPVFFSFKKILAPDDEHYMEEPFGESFFPSPSIGYSRVTVKNIQRKNVTHNATGMRVNEFYTAKDFPTITERTDMKPIREKNNPLSLSTLFKLKVKDYMTASQGYLIENNDMHGKEKGVSVYQQGQTTPITSVEYRYKSSPYLNNSFRLDNTATAIFKNGSIDNSASIGVFMDYVSDMRESTNETTSSAFNFNTDGFIIPPIPAVIPIPIGLPSFTNEKTQFRSAVVVKKFQKFGILEETIAKDLGSTVSTKNLAYDAETGEVLLTETTTDFNDKVYTLTYPAYWFYTGMGPAYKNIGFSKSGITFSNGSANVNNALAYFAEGDELALAGGTTAWVLAVTPNSVQAVNRAGDPVSGIFNKIIHSGLQNKLKDQMATITSLSNPLTNLQSNVYENVLQAQAIEYTNNWKTFCDCFEGSATTTTNPYILGTKGKFKNKKSYLYLAGRTQSNYNSNTNIRKDGVFTSYTPFYKLNAGKWEIDDRNWTYTSEVTEFSPFGAELENKDALGRYSAATFGYNQTLPTAVAANSKYRDLGSDNFEDYDFSRCADNHFKFRNYESNVSDVTSHTGTKSIRVTSGIPVNMTKQLEPCDSNTTCNLQLTTTFFNPATNQFCISVTGGTAPYVFDWTSQSCDIAVTISDSGSSLCGGFPSSPGCKLILHVTDKNNCRKTFNIDHPFFISHLNNRK